MGGNKSPHWLWEKAAGLYSGDIQNIEQLGQPGLWPFCRSGDLGFSSFARKSNWRTYVLGGNDREASQHYRY